MEITHENRGEGQLPDIESGIKKGAVILIRNLL